MAAATFRTDVEALKHPLPDSLLDMSFVSTQTAAEMISRKLRELANEIDKGQDAALVRQYTSFLDGSKVEEDVPCVHVESYQVILRTVRHPMRRDPVPTPDGADDG